MNQSKASDSLVSTMVRVSASSAMLPVLQVIEDLDNTYRCECLI